MEGTMESGMNRKIGRADTEYLRRIINHYRGGGVCMDVDGVEDNGTMRDELVDAEIEGTVRFGGLGEFFTP